MPIGAFVSSREIMVGLSDRPILGHITTFGGHPVSCAAGLATLTALIEERCYVEVPVKNARFLERLKHPEIRDVRHAGLWMAVELDDFDKVQAVIKYCLENGLITDWFLFNNRCIRIAPPLIITLEEIDLACDILLAGLDSLG